jgi:hypothetical protein
VSTLLTSPVCHHGKVQFALWALLYVYTDCRVHEILFIDTISLQEQLPSYQRRRRNGQTSGYMCLGTGLPEAEEEQVHR